MDPSVRRRCARSCAGLGAGLAAAHAVGVVHRDISPGNIILPDGRAENAKLIDFGVAAMATVPGQTLVGDFKGKLAYASPEQFGLYGGKVDSRSDIYSFGLVLAEAASGAPIPMGQTFTKRSMIRKAEPRIPPNVPAVLRTEISPLLQPDPKDRPQSAADLARAAAPETRNPRVIEPGPATDEPAAGKKGQTHWLVPLLYSATAVGVGIGLGFMTWIFRTAGVPPAAPPATQAPAAPAPTPSTVPTNPPKVRCSLRLRVPLRRRPSTQSPNPRWPRPR